MKNQASLFQEFFILNLLIIMATTLLAWASYVNGLQNKPKNLELKSYQVLLETKFSFVKPTKELLVLEQVIKESTNQEKWKMDLSLESIFLQNKQFLQKVQEDP